MNRETIANAIDSIEPCFLEEAADYIRTDYHRIFVSHKRAVACLACFLSIVLLGGTVLSAHSLLSSPDPSLGVTVPNSDWSQSPPDSGTVMMDTALFFVYRGNFYRQCAYSGTMESNRCGLKLGSSINVVSDVFINGEPSNPLTTPEVLAGIFAEGTGSAHGDFYAVKGYDPSFLLCMKDGDSLNLFVNEGGYTLCSGADLYKDRLRLSDGTVTATYRGQNENDSAAKELDRAALSTFLQALYDGEVVLTDEILSEEEWHDLWYRYEYEVFLQKSDGLILDLTILAGGYVCLSDLSSVMVKLSEEAYADWMDALH